MSHGLPTQVRTTAFGSPARFATPMSPATSPASDAWPDRASTIVPDWSVISTNAPPPMSSMRSTRTTAGELAGTAGPVGVAVGDGAVGEAVGVTGGGHDGRPAEEPADRGDPDRRDEDEPQDGHQWQRPQRPGEPAAGHRVAAEDGEGIAPARMCLGVSQGRIDRPVRGVRGALVEPRAEAAVEVVRAGHAERSFASSVRASASRAARSARVA